MHSHPYLSVSDMNSAAMIQPGEFIRTGKKTSKKDYITVDQGKNRLFGGDDAKALEELKRTGKRVIRRPHEEGLSIIQWGGPWTGHKAAWERFLSNVIFVIVCRGTASSSERLADMILK